LARFTKEQERNTFLNRCRSTIAELEHQPSSRCPGCPRNPEAQAKGQTPPVFIVVCNNTNVSKLVFDYLAGWEKTLPDGATIVVTGQLPIFSNEANGSWRVRPNAILIDSEQLESGEAMSPEFKKLAARKIEEFKAEYRLRFPGRSVDNITDEDLLREVMNTIGKPGKLGEQVKCVVSVRRAVFFYPLFRLCQGPQARPHTHPRADSP